MSAIIEAAVVADVTTIAETVTIAAVESSSRAADYAWT